MGVQFFCIPFFVMRAEDAPRTVGGRFRYRVPPNEDVPRTVGGRFRYRVPPNEDVPRTVGGRFRYRISLPYRRSLFFTPNASENASRTPGSLFEHGTHIPYRRSLFLVPSPLAEASCRRSGAWPLPMTLLILRKAQTGSMLPHCSTTAILQKILL